jgi:predicted Fe-Mo cluster-binding NifX family protein
MSRFAIATADGVSVCDHLARSGAFVIVEVEEGRETARSIRRRNTDACGNHRTFVQLVEGCGAVICGGIGEGAASALQANGVATVVLAERTTIEAAIAGYLAGTLATTDARVCLCSH